MKEKSYNGIGGGGLRCLLIKAKIKRRQEETPNRTKTTIKIKRIITMCES
jgi:hypothetical protein